MKKCSKIVLCTTAFIMLEGVITSFAGQWKSDAKGWWYDKGSSYAISEWIEDNGKWYYVGEEGYMLSNAWAGNYYLGADGVMLVNTTTPDGYQVDENGARIQEINIQDTGYLEKYAEVLRGLPPNDKYDMNRHTFQLVYVDEDSVPELFVYVGSYKPDPHIYIYDQGNVKLLGNFGGRASFSYVERGNLIYSSFYDNGNRESHNFYTIKDGENIPVVKFYADESRVHYGEDNYYLINDQEVSELVYKSQLNAMKNGYSFKEIHFNESHEVNEENIQKMLVDMNTAM